MKNTKKDLEAQIKKLNNQVKKLTSLLAEGQSKKIKTSVVNSKKKVEKGQKLSHGQKVEVLKTAPHSSCFSKIEYSPKTKELTLHFRRGHKNGNIYTYGGIPANIYSKFITADSLGKFYATKIKNTYYKTK